MARELNPVRCLANAAGLSYDSAQKALSSRPVTYQVAIKIVSVCPVIPIEAFNIVGDRRAGNGLTGFKKLERLQDERFKIKEKISVKLAGIN